MRPGRASRTAAHNALFRALESSLPDNRRLFDDPLARSFLTWPLRTLVRVAALPGLRGFVPWLIDRRWPGVRPSVVARTRLIDEAITGSITTSVDGSDDDSDAQLVILGAGYDSRAYRLPSLQHITVFEVDHPDTQRAKRRALSRTLPREPANVRYIASDFNQHQLEPAMAAAGYQEGEPTVFLWEGVTNYLTEAAVDATLCWCARAAAGSVVIFTYIHQDVLTNPGRFVGTDRLFATLASVGEKLTFGIDPAKLPGFLADRGLSLERDIGAADYRELYFKEAARRMRGHEFYRLAIAKVGTATSPPRLASSAPDG